MSKQESLQEDPCISDHWGNACYGLPGNEQYEIHWIAESSQQGLDSLEHFHDLALPF